MYTRRKIVLHLINLLGEATSLQIQKIIFLFTLAIKNKNQIPYQFFPNIKGCYSIALSNDYHILHETGILNYNSFTQKYSLNRNIDFNLFAIDSSTELLLKKISTQYGTLSEKELAELTYKEKPFYAIRSKIVGELNLPDTFFSDIKKIELKIASYPRTIYTIGYEERTIDDVIRNLICRNIKILIDVRKNAFSMKKEFSKNNLKLALKEAEIEYIHCPEVGIETDKRKEFLPEARYSELFEWYEKNILPAQLSFVEMVNERLEKESVAFMCYEKNPADCHRTYLAKFCLLHNPKLKDVRNIVKYGKDECICNC